MPSVVLPVFWRMRGEVQRHGTIEPGRESMRAVCGTASSANATMERLTKEILPSRGAAAGLCGGVRVWARDGWWFRAWPGLRGAGG